MKLTKAQRHTIYKECLLNCLYQKRKLRSYFICWTLRGIVGKLKKKVDKFDLPELMRHCPGKSNLVIPVSWWPDYDYLSRIKVLRACIRETAPKKRK